MAEQKTFESLSNEEKESILKRLKDQADLLGYQEDIARSKANIQKHRYEEILYALKIAELINPEKNEQNQSSADESKS